MKILYIGFNPRFYGNFRRMSQLGKQLAERGHEVTLLTTSLDRHLGISETNFWGFRLVETPDLFRGALRSGWDPWNTLARISWLGQRSFDIVHAFESRPAVIFPALWASRQNRARLFIDWADWFGKGGSVEERPNRIVRSVLRPVETFFENQFRPMADVNTVISSELKKKALGLGIAAGSVFQIPDGSDSASLQPMDPWAAKEQAGYSKDQYVIGYLGSLFYQDAQFLAKAWLRVLEKCPTAKFFWFGARPAHSIALIEQLPNTQIIGRFPQEKMAVYLSSLDVGWLPLLDSPANRGRWPSKLNEYMCVGIPVVATKVGDVQDLFNQYEIGRLSTVNSQEMADVTIDLLGDPVLRRKMGQNARWVAEYVLDWKILSEQIENLYLEAKKMV